MPKQVFYKNKKLTISDREFRLMAIRGHIIYPNSNTPIVQAERCFGLRGEHNVSVSETTKGGANPDH